MRHVQRGRLHRCHCCPEVFVCFLNAIDWSRWNGWHKEAKLLRRLADLVLKKWLAQSYQVRGRHGARVLRERSWPCASHIWTRAGETYHMPTTFGFYSFFEKWKSVRSWKSHVLRTFGPKLARAIIHTIILTQFWQKKKVSSLQYTALITFLSEEKHVHCSLAFAMVLMMIIIPFYRSSTV